MRIQPAKDPGSPAVLLTDPLDVMAKNKLIRMRTQASNCFIARFLSANADGGFDIADKHFAVANLAGSRRPNDGFDGLLDQGIGQDDLDLDFWKEIDRIFTAAVNFRVALLAAKTLHLGDGQALRAHSGQRLFNFFEFERFDNGFNLFHGLRVAQEGY